MDHFLQLGSSWYRNLRKILNRKRNKILEERLNNFIEEEQV